MNDIDRVKQDEYYMQKAIQLAKRGQYTTKPNPNVGCVIVKEGKIIGQGFHQRAGQPHAEVNALCDAQESVENATVYVTLEPCAHYGKTPPCAKTLIEAKVKRVVIACCDPNPLVAGKGIKLLQQAGILVTTGICEQDAKQLNLGFLKAMATGLPYVRLKIASSLDGRTAMQSGESKWITGEQARQDVQHWRAISGAVITGINTVLKDDCQLNVRKLLDDQGQPIEIHTVVQPIPIVLDRTGRLPLTAKILQSSLMMIMGQYRSELDQDSVIQLAERNLVDLLKTLCQQYQIYDVLIEAGATLSTTFLQQGLVDEVIYYLAPTFLGQTARPVFSADIQQLQEQYRFDLKTIQHIGNDIRLHLIPNND